MKQLINSHSIIDYRNARYQGSTDNQGNRQSLGILVDDDLSFYVSHWNDNLLSGQTLVYISHGKYIYGQWRNNEPHGLNVFRTGDTVLVGEFKNGKLIGKILVIFQRYNIIAILQTKAQKDKFDVLQCGKLMTHDNLIKYIGLLDVQMPENYFSLIKFVTSLTSDEDEDSQTLLASPCEGENCYFGYRDGLAIIFNSNNGVVSVGQHQNQRLNGFGGKFDGKKIEEGNFELQQTITYQKKRPDNEVHTIFQKMHKRSLNFKNQYFDSKVKTLGDLQTILRGNIQKIVNYNMKNGLREATAQDLNDSLDYQNFQNYESIKTAENRQNMYEKEPTNLKKTTSQYYKEQRQNKCFSKSPKPNISQSTSRKVNRINPDSQNYSQSHAQQTVRRTPVKDSAVCYAKKSPIRFKQEDRQVYGKQSKTYEKYTQNHHQQSRGQRHNPEPVQREQTKIGKTYKRNSVYQRKQRNYDKSPLNYSKNSQKRGNQKQNRQMIPKFAGLEIQQTEKPFHKSTVENQVEQYKKQLQKSRSKQRIQGKSLSKYLKRPNYEDIEERRKRLLNQFKELNNDSNTHSKISTTSDRKMNPHKASLEIQINENSRQNSIAQSPCMKEKILSFTSDNQMMTQNSEQGCLPLSLVNAQKTRNNRNKHSEVNLQKNGSAFSKKESIIQRMQLSSNKSGKQNLSYTPGSFAKHKKDNQNSKVDNYANDKRNQIRRFYCQEAEQLESVSMTKKTQSQHTVSENQEEEDNQFSYIQLKHQSSQKGDNYPDKKHGGSQRFQKQEPARSRQQLIAEKQAVNILRENYGNKDRAQYQRDLSPSIVSEVSRRKTGYKYLFQ